jgi:hypothetical protein
MRVGFHLVLVKGKNQQATEGQKQQEMETLPPAPF